MEDGTGWSCCVGSVLIEGPRWRPVNNIYNIYIHIHIEREREKNKYIHLLMSNTCLLSIREMGGAPRNPAPRNHFLVRIVKSPGCHRKDAFGGEEYRRVPTPLRSTSPSSEGLRFPSMACLWFPAAACLWAVSSIGWSNSHFNNLHFIMSLETNVSSEAQTIQLKSRYTFVNFRNVGCWSDSKTRTWIMTWTWNASMNQTQRNGAHASKQHLFRSQRSIWEHLYGMLE